MFDGKYPAGRQEQHKSACLRPLLTRGVDHDLEYPQLARVSSGTGMVVKRDCSHRQNCASSLRRLANHWQRMERKSGKGTRPTCEVFLPIACHSTERAWQRPMPETR